ncbi:MAG TPA: hypothetical protein PLA90_17340, partial [Candidatus Sumerlaeota bacterium]|nr:hypothetical protein [Candidatus Sumerlaeota bacterium]
MLGLLFRREESFGRSKLHLFMALSLKENTPFSEGVNPITESCKQQIVCLNRPAPSPPDQSREHSNPATRIERRIRDSTPELSPRRAAQIPGPV